VRVPHPQRHVGEVGEGVAAARSGRGGGSRWRVGGADDGQRRRRRRGAAAQAVIAGDGDWDAAAGQPHAPIHIVDAQGGGGGGAPPPRGGGGGGRPPPKTGPHPS